MKGNIIKFLFKDVDVSSQRISEFLAAIGSESLQREFFQRYISRFTNAKKGVIDDLKLVPLRVHTEETLRGFLFVQFISLIIFVFFKELFFRIKPALAKLLYTSNYRINSRE